MEILIPLGITAPGRDNRVNIEDKNKVCREIPYPNSVLLSALHMSVVKRRNADE